MPRDKELPRRGAQRTPLPDPVEEEEERHQPPADYVFELEHYTADCFVDIDIMLANYASLARGTFTDNMGREVLVIVPTNSFFALHALDPNAPRLWSSLSLEGYSHCQHGGQISNAHGKSCVHSLTIILAQ